MDVTLDMFYHLYSLGEEFDAARFEKLPRTIEPDDEGVCVAKSASLKGARIFYAIVQQTSRSAVDPIASAIGLGGPAGPSIKKTLLASVVPESGGTLLVCSGRHAWMAADRLVNHLASVDRPTMSIVPFSPENDIITALCEKLNGFGMNLEKGEWVFRGKRGGREFVRIAGQTFFDILSSSEVFELLGLSGRPMVFGQIRVGFPGVPGEALWRLWRTRARLGYSISLSSPGAPLSLLVDVGLKAASVLLEANATGLVKQSTLDSLLAAATEA